MARSCIFMSAPYGDLRIEWEETNREQIVQQIQAMMDKGVTFHILADSPEQVRPIASTEELSGQNATYIKDPDIKHLIEANLAQIARFATTGDLVTVGTAKTAEEAASKDTVAIPPKKGG